MSAQTYAPPPPHKKKKPAGGGQRALPETVVSMKEDVNQHQDRRRNPKQPGQQIFTHDFFLVGIAMNMEPIYLPCPLPDVAAGRIRLSACTGLPSRQWLMLKLVLQLVALR